MAATGREDYQKFSVQVTVIGKKERKQERKMNKEGKKERKKKNE